MAINNLNQAPQAVQTLQNEAAVNSNISKTIKDINEDKRSKTISSDEAVSNFVETGDTEQTSLAMLKGLVAKAFDSGVFTVDKTGNKVGLKEREDSKELDEDRKGKDSVSISSSSLKKQQKSVISRINLPQSLVRDFKGDTEKAVEQFANAYYENLVDNKGKPKSSEKIRKLELILKEKGLSDEKIHTITKEIRNLARADISLKIKESLVFRDLSGSKLEGILSEAHAQATVDGAFYNKELGGWDFGGFNTSLKGTVERAKDTASQEMDRFAVEELETQLMSKILKRDNSAKDISTLLDVCRKHVKNFDEWIESIWQKKKDDLGFTLMDVPDKSFGNIVNTSSDNSQDQKKKKEYEEEATTEEKLLSNQLRTIYMEKLMTGKGSLDFGTFFKIRKLKNGLIQLGIFSKEFDEKLKFEAEMFAKEKVRDDLTDLLLEKASVFDEKGKGPASELINKKMDNILKCAKRVGIQLSDDELKTMQSKADQRILGVLQRQIELYETLASKRSDPALERELKKFKSLESRLLGRTKEPSAEDTLHEDLTSEIA